MKRRCSSCIYWYKISKRKGTCTGIKQGGNGMYLVSSYNSYCEKYTQIGVINGI